MTKEMDQPGGHGKQPATIFVNTREFSWEAMRYPVSVPTIAVTSASVTGTPTRACVRQSIATQMAQS